MSSPVVSGLSLFQSLTQWLVCATCEQPDCDCKMFHATTDRINYELLKRNDPIMFYDELTLYEDELHDNGLASLRVKLVRPSCVLSLSLSLCECSKHLMAPMMNVLSSNSA